MYSILLNLSIFADMVTRGSPVIDGVHSFTPRGTDVPGDKLNGFVALISKLILVSFQLIDSKVIICHAVYSVARVRLHRN